MIVGFSLVAGLAAGLALALGLEFSKSSFRNVQEITRVMVVPVLGSVNRIVTLRELRLAAGRRW
jgi:capsular polysaccharide biosynthesis protein